MRQRKGNERIKKYENWIMDTFWVCSKSCTLVVDNKILRMLEGLFLS